MKPKTNKTAILAAGAAIVAGAIATGVEAKTVTGSDDRRPDAAQGQIFVRGGIGVQGRGGESGDERQGQGIMGKVTAISGTTLTVESSFGRPMMGNANQAASNSYSVDASKASFKKMGQPAAAAGGESDKPAETAIAITDLSVGDLVRVEGTVTGNAMAATSVLVMPVTATGGIGIGIGDNMISGTVRSVSGTTLTVKAVKFGDRSAGRDKANDSSAAATVYTVDASSATVKKYSAPVANANSARPTETTIAVSDIAVGDTVRVEGVISGTSVAAKTIVDGQVAPGAMMNRGNFAQQIDKAKGASDLKAEVEAVKPGLWAKITSFFSSLFGKRK